jgi:type II secretory pathway component PulC
MGIRVGDIIKGINQQDTATVRAFNSVTRKIDPSNGIVFDVVRRGMPLYISYKGK